jgi:hypothetical protein
MSILDVGNFGRSSDPAVRDVLNGKTYPGKEYSNIALLAGNCFNIYRYSLGDFPVDANQAL